MEVSAVSSEELSAPVDARKFFESQGEVGTSSDRCDGFSAECDAFDDPYPTRYKSEGRSTDKGGTGYHEHCGIACPTEKLFCQWPRFFVTYSHFVSETQAKLVRYNSR